MQRVSISWGQSLKWNCWMKTYTHLDFFNVTNYLLEKLYQLTFYQYCMRVFISLHPCQPWILPLSLVPHLIFICIPLISVRLTTGPYPTCGSPPLWHQGAAYSSLSSILPAQRWMQHLLINIGVRHCDFCGPIWQKCVLRPYKILQCFSSPRFHCRC